MKHELHRLSENLTKLSRRQATRALIIALQALLAKRFRSQRLRFKRDGMQYLLPSLVTGDLREPDLMMAVHSVVGVEVFRFAERYEGLLEKARAAGSGIAAAELGIAKPGVSKLQLQKATELQAELDATTVVRVTSAIKAAFQQRSASSDATSNGAAAGSGGKVGSGPTRGELQKIVGDMFTEWANRADPTSRSNVAALNEISKAFHEGMLATGSYEAGTMKEWLDEETACPICSGNVGESIHVGEPFASGDQAPPAHPNCRCSIRLWTANEAGA